MLAGARVGANGGRVIVPWSERTRYGMRKNGYRGGATLQEMIVPSLSSQRECRLLVGPKALPCLSTVVGRTDQRPPIAVPAPCSSRRSRLARAEDTAV